MLHPKRYAGLLLGWFTLGLVLRLAGLTSKPLWTDEFATIVFSLGNRFRTIPLDQVLSLTELLQPLQPNPQATLADVVRHLHIESNHPPLYFLLTHLWLQLFPTPDGYASVWGARSLSALLGALSIPATFALSWLAFRNRAIAHLATAFTALSPFGIYLAQEARHYTLPILWIIASLACLLQTTFLLRRQQQPPFWLCLIWVVVNALGIATHYFFLLTLAAEGIVLAMWGGVSWAGKLKASRGRRSTDAADGTKADSHPVRLQNLKSKTSSPSLLALWLPIGLVALGTLASALVWLPWMTQSQDSELTRWIYRGDRVGFDWLTPVGQLMGGWITMVYMLPIQASSRVVAIASIVGLLGLTVWTVPLLIRGGRVQFQQSQRRLPLGVLGGFVGAAIALFLGITYLLGIDLTVAFRYNFVYFPAVMLLWGAALAGITNPARRAKPTSESQNSKFKIQNSSRILLILALSFLGALTVITNQGYQKTHRPDLVVEAMRQQAKIPALVAIAHRTHGQTGRLMGIAWEWRRTMGETNSPVPQFLLAHQEVQNPDLVVEKLRRSLSSLPRPLNLWLVEFRDVTPAVLEPALQRENCTLELAQTRVDGYRYQQYRCDSRNTAPPVG